MTGLFTLAHGSAPRLPAGHSLIQSPIELRETLGYLPRGGDWVSPMRPAVLVSLGPSLLWRLRITELNHGRHGSTLEYVMRYNHDFVERGPRSPMHLVQLDRPVERLRFVRYSEGTVFGQLILGEDGRVRLLELPELGLLEDDAYTYQRNQWTWRGSFRGQTADSWIHEGNGRIPLAFCPTDDDPLLRLLGVEAQRALRPHVGSAVAVRGLIQNAQRKLIPWSVHLAFMDEDPPLYTAASAADAAEAA